jgi:hypothetical protein
MPFYHIRRQPATQLAGATLCFALAQRNRGRPPSHACAWRLHQQAQQRARPRRMPR